MTIKVGDRFTPLSGRLSGRGEFVAVEKVSDAGPGKYEVWKVIQPGLNGYSHANTNDLIPPSRGAAS